MAGASLGGILFDTTGPTGMLLGSATLLIGGAWLVGNGTRIKPVSK